MNAQSKIAADCTGPKVYTAIAAVMAEIAREGIAKDRNNAAQGYKFRGIDDVYNALSPILAANGLLMLPRVLNREVAERQTRNGGAMFYVTVEVEFSLIAAEDGSAHVIKTYGEAMDSGDKATNKAMSAAFKYAAMQAFCIPTEGDNDADGSTHQVEPRRSLAVVAATTAITMCNSVADCKAWKASNAGLFGDGSPLTADDQSEIIRCLNQRVAAVKPAPVAPSTPQPSSSTAGMPSDDEIPY